MDAERLLQLLTQLTFFVIFVRVGIDAVRRRYRADIDIALFFGAMAFALGIGWIADALFGERPTYIAILTSSAVMALPYLLLRLVTDFAQVPNWIMRGAAVGLAVSIAAIVTLGELTEPVTFLLALYFFGFQSYAALRFAQKGRESAGVTSRRMRAAALGSVLLGIAILIAGFRAALPDFEPAAAILVQLGALSAGVAYVVSFTPPASLRRAWQQPELHAFLGRVARLTRLPDTGDMLNALEEGAAAALGAERALVLLWDPESGVLRGRALEQDPEPTPARPGEFIVGRVFERQEALFSPNAPADDPEHSEIYVAWGARAVLAAPITAGGERLGVLSIYTSRPPVFAHDDLELVRLLAEQSALVLENRQLLEQAALVRAREESTRLKDDFLSAAAHDLKTPLTSVIAYTQLLQRRAAARPDEASDPEVLGRIASEADRLRTLVAKLLDVAKGEHGQFTTERVPVDLLALARNVCARNDSERHPCIVNADAPVIVQADSLRLSQLLENLVENAVKYSPEGGEVRVDLWCHGDEARIAVADRGMGIPPADLPYVFERFRRAANLDDRRFAGMGLGLYICRLIVEEHGGRIWAESRPGTGSTFQIALPRDGVTEVN